MRAQSVYRPWSQPAVSRHRLTPGILPFEEMCISQRYYNGLAAAERHPELVLPQISKSLHPKPATDLDASHANGQ